jgi:hypothetical protein
MLEAFLRITHKKWMIDAETPASSATSAIDFMAGHIDIKMETLAPFTKEVRDDFREQCYTQEMDQVLIPYRTMLEATFQRFSLRVGTAKKPRMLMSEFVLFAQTVGGLEVGYTLVKLAALKKLSRKIILPPSARAPKVEPIMEDKSSDDESDSDDDDHGGAGGAGGSGGGGGNGSGGSGNGGNISTGSGTDSSEADIAKAATEGVSGSNVVGDQRTQDGKKTAASAAKKAGKRDSASRYRPANRGCVEAAELQHCVTAAKLRSKDDLANRKNFISLTFTDFLEALCRLASLMAFPTKLKLAQLSVKGAWHVYEKRATAEAAGDKAKLVVMEAVLSPVSTNGEDLAGGELRDFVANWAIDAPLHEKVESLLGCIFYPMDPDGFKRDGVPRMIKVIHTMDKIAPHPVKKKKGEK